MPENLPTPERSLKEIEKENKKIGYEKLWFNGIILIQQGGIDMVKDLSEAIYYCEVTKAMQHSTVPETKEKMAQYEMPHTTPPIS